MSDSDAFSSDMAKLPWNRSEEQLEALIAGVQSGSAPDSGEEPLAELLSALVSPASAQELAGEPSALAAFRASVAIAPAAAAGAAPARSRRTTLIRKLVATRVAVAAAAGALGLGGLAAAAYADVLPTSFQNFAHQTIGAPSPEQSSATSPDEGTTTLPEESTTLPHESTTLPEESTTLPHESATTSPSRQQPGNAVGPDATGPAAFGLCTAYSHAGMNGEAAAHSVAFANLIKAAGGAGNVGSYCANITAPSSTTTTDQGATTGNSPSVSQDHPQGPPFVLPSHPVGPPSWASSHQGGSGVSSEHGSSSSHGSGQGTGRP